MAGLLAIGTPAFSATETEAELFFLDENKSKDPVDAILPLLKRFQINDEYGVSNDEFDVKLYQAYREGRVTEDEYTKFMNNNFREDRRDTEEIVTWRRVSFAFYEEKDTKVRLEVKPRDRSVMLKFTFKAPKPK